MPPRRRSRRLCSPIGIGEAAPQALAFGLIGSIVLGYVLFGADIDDGAVQLSGIIGSVIGAVVLLLIWRAWNKRQGGSRLSYH